MAMSKKPTVKSGVNQLIRIWKEIFPLVTDAPGLAPVGLTGKQAGQMKLFMKAVGDDAPDILRYAMKNWMDVIVFVKGEVNYCAIPTIPNIGWLLKYATLISIMFHKANAPEVIIKKVAPAKKNLLTLEQIWAKLEED